MAGMRLLLGSVFRNTDVKKLWIAAFALIGLGLIFLAVGKSFYPSVTGLILLGAGLAGGFPLMLGFVGDRYKALSGTIQPGSGDCVIGKYDHQLFNGSYSADLWYPPFNICCFYRMDRDDISLLSPSKKNKEN